MKGVGLGAVPGGEQTVDERARRGREDAWWK